jgi:hypothetical protein
MINEQVRTRHKFRTQEDVEYRYGSSGGSSGGGGTTQTVQKADPWSGLQPFLSREAKPVPVGGQAPTTERRIKGYETVREQTGSDEFGNTIYSPFGGTKVPIYEDVLIPGTSGTPGQSGNITSDGGGLFQRAEKLSQTPIGVYGGQIVANQTPEQTLAQNLTTNRALMGNPLTGMAQNQAYNTLGGNYFRNPDLSLLGGTLGGMYNPANNPMFQRQMAEQIGGIGANAMQAGRYGSGIHGQILGNTLGSLAAQAYEPERARQFSAQQYATGLEESAFQAERARQQQAMQNAPALSQADYADISQLAKVGEDKRAYQQALLDAQQAQFYKSDPYAQQRQQLQDFGGLLGAISTPSSGTSTTYGGQLYQPSFGSQLAGGGLMGAGAYGLASAAGMSNPYAALLGGGVGLASLLR